ncbi:MAG: class I SAM-dependent methyltransferase [Thermomicrobiales bacterium]
MSNPAETYERYMVPPLFAPATERLLDVARPKPGERVLDVGCGTGIVARHAASRVEPSGTVTGLDISPGMLDVARATSEREGLAIDWHEGRAEALPFADGAFDLALCQFALMFFTDRAAALAETRRVLTDGGRVGVSVFQPIACHPFYVALDASIERRLGTSGVAEIFALGEVDTLRALLADAGFREIDFAPVTVTARFPNPAAFLAGEIDVDTAAIPAMQHLDAAARQELAAAIRDDMAAPLREVTEGDHVVLPFHISIARAYR